MTLYRRPVGVLILALWLMGQALLALAVAYEVRGNASTLIGFVGVLHVALAAGLFRPFNLAWEAAVGCVALNIFAFGLVFWSVILVWIYLTLKSSDMPAVALVMVYYAFLCWAFVYLFHPEVRDYFEPKLLPRDD
jgi:hypothetical protein